MDFRELSYITAIAKYQNITKAAESLYISQPTLSKFLKALEEDIGLKLFRRLGNRYVLTHAGECYLQKAEQILQLKNELDLELADIMKRDVGVLLRSLSHDALYLYAASDTARFPKALSKRKGGNHRSTFRPA